MKKTNAILIFVGSVGLIVVAVIFSSIINQTKDANIQDIRTRAATINSIAFTATVAAYEQRSNTLAVSDLRFDEKDAQSLGNWSVLVPSGYEPAQFPPGTKIKISATPATFNVTTRSVSAIQISKR